MSAISHLVSPLFSTLFPVNVSEIWLRWAEQVCFNIEVGTVDVHIPVK